MSYRFAEPRRGSGASAGAACRAGAIAAPPAAARRAVRRVTWLGSCPSGPVVMGASLGEVGVAHPVTGKVAGRGDTIAGVPLPGRPSRATLPAETARHHG